MLDKNGMLLSAGDPVLYQWGRWPEVPATVLRIIDPDRCLLQADPLSNRADLERQKEGAPTEIAALIDRSLAIRDQTMAPALGKIDTQEPFEATSDCLVLDETR